MVGKQAVMSNAMEAARMHVQKKAADELAPLREARPAPITREQDRHRQIDVSG